MLVSIMRKLIFLVKSSWYFPPNIINSIPKDSDYIYISDQFSRILKDNQTAFANLVNSNATFPSGSFVYVPKSVIYNNTEFYLFDSSLTDFKTLAEWQQKLYPNFNYKFDTVAGYKVTYFVDSAGNPILTMVKIQPLKWMVKFTMGNGKLKAMLSLKHMEHHQLHGILTTNQKVNLLYTIKQVMTFLLLESKLTISKI